MLESKALLVNGPRWFGLLHRKGVLAPVAQREIAQSNMSATGSHLSKQSLPVTRTFDPKIVLQSVASYLRTVYTV